MQVTVFQKYKKLIAITDRVIMSCIFGKEKIYNSKFVKPQINCVLQEDFGSPEKVGWEN